MDPARQEACPSDDNVEMVRGGGRKRFHEESKKKKKMEMSVIFLWWIKIFLLSALMWGIDFSRDSEINCGTFPWFFFYLKKWRKLNSFVR